MQLYQVISIQKAKNINIKNFKIRYNKEYFLLLYKKKDKDEV